VAKLKSLNKECLAPGFQDDVDDWCTSIPHQKHLSLRNRGCLQQQTCWLLLLVWTVVSVESWEGISWITEQFVRRIDRTLKKWISSQHWRWSTNVDLFLKRRYRMVQMESYNKQSVMFRSIPPRHSYIRLYTTQHTRASTCTEAWGVANASLA